MSVEPLRRWALALSAWSVFVWANRLNNLRTDDVGSAAERGLSYAMSVVSLLLAAVAVAFVVRAWRRGWPEPRGAERHVLLGFAGWTVLVWSARVVDIVADWRSVGFVAVHVVLGMVSIGLAVQVWRALRPARLPTLPLEPALDRSVDP
jgi:hypothetical protein